MPSPSSIATPHPSLLALAVFAFTALSACVADSSAGIGAGQNGGDGDVGGNNGDAIAEPDSGEPGSDSGAEPDDVTPDDALTPDTDDNDSDDESDDDAGATPEDADDDRHDGGDDANDDDGTDDSSTPDGDGEDIDNDGATDTLEPRDADSATDALTDSASDASSGPVPCDDGTLCNDGRLCCTGTDVCLGNTCAASRGPCIDSFDCPIGSFCEPVFGVCLDQPDTLSCEVIPDFDTLTTDVEWSFTAEQIISIPVVADLQADGIPDVVVNLTRTGTADWAVGEIMALQGRTGDILWRIPNNIAENQYGSHGRATIAVGDVSGDGLPDVVYASRANSSGRSLIIAANHNGEFLWKSVTADGADVRTSVVNGAITLANFDDDPMAEVVVGATLIDHDGTVIWNEDDDGARFGSNDGYTGGISVVVNLDADPTPEIISGRHAWNVAWNAADPAATVVTPLWDSAIDDGYPAVADLDLDGTPEVVLVGDRQLTILDGATGTRWCGRGDCPTAGDLTATLLLPGGASSNRGGPPTIADFDNDGRPEIGIAGGYAYTVYDINRPGEAVIQPAGSPAPAAGAIYIRWSRATQDLSSNATGSSVFDFQGDGAAEVVYADECFLRIYDGRTGDVIFQQENSSATIHEYPIVVDVDADGNSEILVVANDASGVQGCGAGYRTRRGLFVYGDPGNSWVRTRRVWTQHAWHVTNATSAGNVPLSEDPHWLTEGLNAYRQNVQGEGVFNAPDLSIDRITIDDDRCTSNLLGIIVTLRNSGTIGVPAGIPVRLYTGDTPPRTLLQTLPTPAPILPGTTIQVRFDITVPEREDESVYVAIDDTDTGGTLVECDESNNTRSISLFEACGT